MSTVIFTAIFLPVLAVKDLRLPGKRPSDPRVEFLATPPSPIFYLACLIAIHNDIWYAKVSAGHPPFSDELQSYT
jgi:hypothetical protein